MVRHSAEDALSDVEFEHLVEATDELRPPFDAETMFILIAGGRLGMRAGEICHMSEHWIDWDRKLIEIPQHDPCTKADGKPCGYCRQQAGQSAENTGEEYQEIIDAYWQPKTSTSARAIPFDFDDRVETVLEMFFEHRDEYPHSRVSINRRVDRVAEAAGIDPGSVYPHALRATAATYHAFRGLTAIPLQSLMGWRQLSTAQKYIRKSGGATAKALRDAHSG